MIEASEGGKKQTETMNALGLSYAQLASLTPTEQMELLAQRISAIPDPAQRSALAMEIFGRSGGELMPLLRNMSEELDVARTQLGSYPEAINRANQALDDIGDNFAAISVKAREFVTGALVDIAPTIARASEELARMDFAGMGIKLSEILQRTYDFFVGLWQNPAQIFDLFGSYLDAQLRIAGDTLATAFMTAVNTFGNLLNELISGGAFNRISDVVANAFVVGVTKFNLELMNALEGAARFWGGLWDLVTGQGTQSFAEKLYSVVELFASDFGRAMIDPIGFIGNKLTSALMGASQQASTDYQYAFNEASGAWVDRHKTGLEAAHESAGQRLQTSLGEAGQAITSAMQSAANNAEIVEVNLFGGKDAVQRTNELAQEIANNGAQFRASMESSIQPSQTIASNFANLGESIERHMRESETLSANIKLNLEGANAAAQQIPSAFDLGNASSNKIALNLENSAGSAEAAGSWFGQSEKAANRISIHGAEFETSAADAAGQINTAKGDAKIITDVMTGPSGLTSKFNEAMSRTKQLRDTIDYFIAAGKEVADNLRAASRADGNMREYERNQDRAHNLRERGYDRIANQIERNAKEKFLRDELKDRMRQNAEDKLERQLKRASEALSLKEANEIRMAAERQFRQSMEEIGRLTKEQLNEAALGLKEGAQIAGQQLSTSGKDVGSALKEAASALRDALSGRDDSQSALALESTLQQCREFLESINEKLPQHALS
jgi:hypothetical protein